MARIFRLAEKSCRFHDGRPAIARAAPAEVSAAAAAPKQKHAARRTRLDYSPLPRTAESLHVPRTRPLSASPTRRDYALPTVSSANKSRLPSTDSGVCLQSDPHTLKSASLDQIGAKCSNVDRTSVEEWLSSVPNSPETVSSEGVSAISAIEATSKDQENLSSRSRLGSFLLGQTPRRNKIPARPSVPRPSPFGKTQPTRYKGGAIPVPLRKRMQFKPTGPVNFDIGPPSRSDSGDSSTATSSHESLRPVREVEEISREEEDQKQRYEDQNSGAQEHQAHQSPNVQVTRGRTVVEARCASYYDDDVL